VLSQADKALRGDLAAANSTVLVGGVEARLLPTAFATVADMLAYNNHMLGKRYSTRATEWQVFNDYGISVGGGLYVRATTDIVASDYMVAVHYANAESPSPSIDSTAILQQATNDAFACKCNVIISTVFYLTGSGGVNSGRITDGVNFKSGVSYYAIRRGEIRLALSCVIGMAYRPNAPVTALSQAPTNVNFHGVKFTRPNSTWDVALENTALLYIAAINGMKIQGCEFVGWVGDAILFGINDDATLSAVLETYINNVEVSGCLFDGVNNGNRQSISILEGVDMHLHHNVYKNCTRSESPHPMPGAIDIEPILASAKVSNIIVENETFDNVGGVTGVVSLALSFPLTNPAHNIHVRNNTFRNTKNIADFYAFGPTSTNHTSMPANAPYNVSFTGNTQEDLPALVQSRRWFCGGIDGLNISRNTVIGGSDAAILGFDDGTNKWPIRNLTIDSNNIKNWIISGGETVAPITLFGGVIGATICDNTFTDCGNKVGSPVNMCCYSFAGNAQSSKNVVMHNDTFINTGAFTASSHPYHAPALANPKTFYITNMVFIGINSTAYTYTNGLYNKANTDYFDNFVTMPSTNSPVISGLSKLIGSTGDTWTNFTGGSDGQQLTVIAEASGVTIQNNANIVTKSGSNAVLAAGKTIKLVSYNNKWYEV
jgi:hypothetical protein